jgi:hypothetical protein
MTKLTTSASSPTPAQANGVGIDLYSFNIHEVEEVKVVARKLTSDENDTQPAKIFKRVCEPFRITLMMAKEILKSQNQTPERFYGHRTAMFSNYLSIDHESATDCDEEIESMLSKAVPLLNQLLLLPITDCDRIISGELSYDNVVYHREFCFYLEYELDKYISRLQPLANFIICYVLGSPIIKPDTQKAFSMAFSIVDDLISQSVSVITPRKRELQVVLDGSSLYTLSP